jgi:hypothetical protein
LTLILHWERLRERYRGGAKWRHFSAGAFSAELHPFCANEVRRSHG